MAEQNWTLRGEYMESCNCDYLCPCIYTNPQGPATHDHCTALMAFRIDEGRSGATRLDGLKFAFVIRSGKVMADGNWIFGVVVDEAADPDQRQAARSDCERRGRRHPGGDPAEPRRRFPWGRVSADRFRHRRPDPPPRDPGDRLVRDRRRRFAQPQRRPVLHRQYRASGKPPPRAGALEGNPSCTPSVSTWTSAARAITGISRHSRGLPDPARRNDRNRPSLQGSVEGIGTTTQKSPQSCRILDGEQRRNQGRQHAGVFTYFSARAGKLPACTRKLRVRCRKTPCSGAWEFRAVAM